MSFVSKEPQLEDYWRGIILFGRNVASYKFALAKSLLELQPTSGELIKLGDLAPIYDLPPRTSLPSKLDLGPFEVHSTG